MFNSADIEWLSSRLIPTFFCFRMWTLELGRQRGAWYLFSRNKTWSFIIGKGLKRLATLTKWLERPQLAGQPGTFSLHAVLIPPPPPPPSPPHPPWCIMWSFYFPSTLSVVCVAGRACFFVMWPWCNPNRARVFRIESNVLHVVQPTMRSTLDVCDICSLIARYVW